jgi:hypothetical protein
MKKENLVKCKDDCECYDCREVYVDPDTECIICGKYAGVRYCVACFENAERNMKIEGAHDELIKNEVFIEEFKLAKIDELETILNWCNMGGLDVVSKLNEIHSYCERKLKDLKV